MKIWAHTDITFCRLRPAHRVTEATAATRRAEGTTTLELPSPDDRSVTACMSGGLLPVSVGVADGEVISWVVPPDEALDLSGRGVGGWRLTVVHADNRSEVIDALARTGAAFLRTRRSRVGEAADICGLPAIAARPSVFADSVGEAVTAVDEGARDLLLRDWDTERIGELRVALGGRLVERVAVPGGITVDAARDALARDLYKVYLDLVDGSGYARPRYAWAPGMAASPPLSQRRISAAWPDALWTDGAWPGMAQASPEVRAILDRSIEATPPTVPEIVTLLSARGDDVDAIAAVADVLRRERVGETVTYVVNRNINYTNVCYFRCGFCAFSKGPRSLNLRGDPYLMSIEEVVNRTTEAAERGATEVCLQGGIHPEFTGRFYVDVLSSIKAAAPEMHVHGFTPLEVWQGAETLGMSIRAFLEMLKEAGLGTLPGTAAEILDDRIRKHLCPDKIRTSQWAEVMLTAHELGLRSTSTIMFGHIDDHLAWANHLEVIREIQRRTGGFTELVPLPFVHMGAPIYLRGRARPGPTWDEVVLVHAVARLALDGLVPNIQGSWVKLGLDGAARLLSAGCNDLGGTLMNETISRAAGASHGQEVHAAELDATIVGAGRIPARRNTLYEVVGGRVSPLI
ncbi:MAG: 5-amino-6-(D-ribitylamino)uracil--L-tyrosine 4-hydroxyphenyl transferase CofH [Acidimicrobiia bacterium]|nr:5-amino-6-(D-ribitylamino)uracil--L-tyrosine 4-hydroxyphenyl transferase CofH [Acidimicrobiia bacterium]